MELLLILFFATSLFRLTEAKHVKDYDKEEEYDEEDDLFELPPDPNPVAGFHVGPLPNFIELNLHVKYDLTLLEYFGGSKGETEFYVRSVIKLAEPNLRHPQLDIKIHIKVVVILSIILILTFLTKVFTYVCLFVLVRLSK